MSLSLKISFVRATEWDLLRRHRCHGLPGGKADGPAAARAAVTVLRRQKVPELP